MGLKTIFVLTPSFNEYTSFDVSKEKNNKLSDTECMSIYYSTIVYLYINIKIFKCCNAYLRTWALNNIYGSVHHSPQIVSNTALSKYFSSRINESSKTAF